MAEDRFTLLVKPSAVAASDAVADHLAAGVRETDGDRRLHLDSRADAEALAERLTAAGGVGDAPVAVQAVAPSDAAAEAVDAYLVPRPERRTREPDGSLESGLTFDTTATQYGALGETLLTAYASDPPLLCHYARQDLGLGADDPLSVAVDDDPDPVVADRSADRFRWEPDCAAVARAGEAGPRLATYLVEVKTGGGSLLRDQRAVMAAAARRVSVLKVGLDVDELPDSYTARVRAVDSDEVERAADLTLVDAPARTARLDEF
ncbi:MAG: hypothetical protein ABEJ42_01000 [Halobacteriaceae archaeon]